MTINHNALADAHATGRDRVRLTEYVTAADMQQYRGLVAEFVDSPAMDELVRRHGITPPSVDDMLNRPHTRSRTIPALFHWMRANGTGPFHHTATATPPVRPASPQAAFATEQLARDAMLTWARDRDPRLGGSDGDQSYPRRSGTIAGWYDGFESESGTGWRANDFGQGTPLARGFWRDVRDHGYGTPAFAAQPAAAPAIPTWVRTISGIRAGRAHVEAALANVPRTDVRTLLEAYRRHHGGTSIDGYDIERIMGDLGYHDVVLPTVSRWAIANPALAGYATPAATAYDFDLTVEQIAADHVRILAPVADQFRLWARQAGKREAWVEWMLTGEDVQEGGRTLPASYWERPTLSSLTGRGTAWTDWARAHRLEFPTITTAAVPQGDGAVIPIGPDHPGWNEWWERLYVEGAERNSYGSYYNRLAEAMRGPRNPHVAVREQRAAERERAARAAAPAQPRTVRIVLDVPVTTAEATVTADLQAEALRIAAGGAHTVVDAAIR